MLFASRKKTNKQTKQQNPTEKQNNKTYKHGWTGKNQPVKSTDKAQAENMVRFVRYGYGWKVSVYPANDMLHKIQSYQAAKVSMQKQAGQRHAFIHQTAHTDSTKFGGEEHIEQFS